MNSLFALEPSETLLKIRLAMAYTPRNLENHITVRPYNGFLYILKGTYTYSFREESFTARTGDLIYLPAESIPYSYSIGGEENAPAQTLQIEFELTDAKSRKPLSFSTHPFLVSPIDSHSVKYAMKAVISAHTNNAPSSRFIAEAELWRVFALCTEGGREESEDAAKKATAPALQYLEEHYADAVTSTELAALCHLSESQLRRVFKSTVGMSPMAYKKHLLHAAARNLLRVGEFRVGEVAQMLGFCDIYAFSHFFTEVEGVSPREYCRLVKSLSATVDTF